MGNGQSIVIKGDISGSEDLVIAGRVEGSISLDGRALTLASGATVVGTISAASVVVSGTVEGSIEAGERLEVKDTAVIEGDLSTPALVVADGAHVNATIKDAGPRGLEAGRRRLDARETPAGPVAFGRQRPKATPRYTSTMSVRERLTSKNAWPPSRRMAPCLR